MPLKMENRGKENTLLEIKTIYDNSINLFLITILIMDRKVTIKTSSIKYKMRML